MSYNADFRRVGKEYSTMPKTHYFWDMENDSYLMEKDEVGGTTAVYTNEPTRHGNLVSQKRNTDTGYYHFDGQRSTRQLTDHVEDVTDEYSYSAFGETVASSGTTVSPFRFNGAIRYYLDFTTGNYYLHSRMYAPSTARWSSPNPVLLLGIEIHPYRYTANGSSVVNQSGDNLASHRSDGTSSDSREDNAIDSCAPRECKTLDAPVGKDGNCPAGHKKYKLVRKEKGKPDTTMVTCVKACDALADCRPSSKVCKYATDVLRTRPTIEIHRVSCKCVDPSDKPPVQEK